MFSLSLGLCLASSHTMPSIHLKCRGLTKNNNQQTSDLCVPCTSYFLGCGLSSMISMKASKEPSWRSHSSVLSLTVTLKSANKIRQEEQVGLQDQREPTQFLQKP